MQLSTFLSVSALAGIALTAPVELQKRAATTTYVVEMVTLTKTVYGPTTTPIAIHSASAAAFLQQAPAPAPKPTTTAAAPVIVSTPSPSPAPAPVSSPAPVSPAPVGTGWETINGAQCTESWPTSADGYSSPPTSCGISWLDTINMYRHAYGKTPFTWSSRLATVAYNCATGNKGDWRGFQHTNLGSANVQGETMASGNYRYDSSATPNVSPFNHALLQWLCEVPSDSQLQASGFSHRPLCPNGASASETGHHDIFLGEYSSVGCAFAPDANESNGGNGDGLVICDFAM